MSRCCSSRPAGRTLEAACALRDAPESGERVGVAFAAEDVVVLDASAE